MGQYFNLVNRTKRHIVSSYWKGTPPSIDEVREIMKEEKWEDTDIITTNSYCEFYVLDLQNEDWVDYEDCVDDENLTEDDDNKEWKETGAHGEKFDSTYCGN